MPLYEFDCQDCAESVEILVRGSERPVCPQCDGAKLTKKLSVPAHPLNGRSGSLPMASNCAPNLPACGPGCCRLPGR